MKLPFEEAAAEELEVAALWYEGEREGYGVLFLAEVKRVVERAARFPRSGVLVSGMPPSLELRRFGLRRFPYSVVTATLAGRRAVVAVAHDRRRPLYWRERTK